MDNETLVSHIQQGDTYLLGALYQKNKRLVYQTCMRYVRGYHTIDDMAQEAYFPFLRAVYAYRKDTGYRFSTYLCNAISWYFIRQNKQRPPDREVCLLDAPVSADQPDGAHMVDMLADENAVQEGDILDAVAYGAVMPMVKQIFDTYSRPGEPPQPYYAVLEYHFCYGMTYKAIGERLNLSIERVRQLLGRALRILRNPKYRAIAEYREDIIGASYHMGSFGRFKETHTSSTEWAAIKRDSPHDRNGLAGYGNREGDYNFDAPRARGEVW